MRTDIESLSRFLFAAVVSMSAASAIYVAPDYSQQYGDLVVGNITWRNQAKGQDYLLLVAFLFSFLLALIAHQLLSQKIERHWDSRNRQDFHHLIVMCCSPVLLMMGSFISTENTSLFPVYLSTGLLLFVFFSTIILSPNSNRFKGSSFQIQELYSGIWLVTFLPFSISALDYIVPNLFWGLTSGFNILLIGFFVALLLYFAFLLSLHTSTTRRKVTKIILSVSQLGLPLLVLLLIPATYSIEGHGQLGTSTKPVLSVLVGVLIAIAYLEQALRLKHISKPNFGASSVVSSSSLILIGLAFHLSATGLPTVSSDDYHFGEFLTPWSSLWDFGMLPFWDSIPARGLINYLPGLVNELMFDGSAASLKHTYPILYFGYLGLLFATLSKLVGRPIAFLAIIFVPYINGVSEIHLVLSAFLCVILIFENRVKPDSWVLLCLFLGTLAVLFSPGQAALVIVALMPAGMFVLYRGYRTGKLFTKAFLAAFLIFGLFIICTPLWKLIYGAVRYGLEQSSVNSIAHGIEWSRSFGYSTLNAWIVEVSRSSWIIVGAIAAFQLVATLSRDRSKLRFLQVAIPLTVFLICVLFTIRSAGRIDASPSRLGLMSAWAVSVLLPIVFFGDRKRQVSEYKVLIWFFLVGITLSMFHRPGYFSLEAALVDQKSVVRVTREQAQAMVSAQQQFPRYGLAIPTEEHFQRLWETKTFLDIVLDEDETYLDITNRGAQYFYFGRRPPIESAAVYNLVTTKAQLRSIEILSEDEPPAILLDSKNINHDGGGVALRSHLLYRYLLLNDSYRLVQVGAQLWFLKPDRIRRIPDDYEIRIITDHEEVISVLDSIFTKRNLKKIPVSWGQSVATLQKEMNLVTRLGKDKIIRLNNAERDVDGVYRVSGKDPFVRYGFNDLLLSGRNVGLLAFDFHCSSPEGISTVALEVFWETDQRREGPLTSTRFLAEQRGRVLVPLDVYPSWITAQLLKSVRIDIMPVKGGCSNFRIDKVELLQRRAAALSD